MTEKITMSNIVKRYDKEITVLDDIDLTINEGEFFVMVGPSGSGKSTLLRMIAGLEDITDGVMKIDANVINHLPPKKRNLSMVFQSYALYPHMTVRDNILFGLKARKVNKEEQQKRLHETTEMIGLSDYLDRKPRQLSGGQRQRVALARAIVSQAPICLMDEPLSNLDAKLRANMRIEIRRLQRQFGLTMVYVTHDQVEAMTMGDRIMVLDSGKIQQIGRPIDLYNEPENLFVASFIGSPKMNIGTVQKDISSKKFIIEGELAIDVPDRVIERLKDIPNITVGIRAEHITPPEEGKEIHTLEVMNVENLGNETSIAFDVGKEIWTAKWPGQWDIKVGDALPVNISHEDFAYFDSDTTQLIRSSRSALKEGDEIDAVQQQ